MDEWNECRFVRDEKTYMIFACKKCGHFSYAKDVQKTKKCLRCGQIHKISAIKDFVVEKGITAALNKVKELQNKLAVQELGSDPTFKAKNEFSITYFESNEKKNIIAKNKTKESLEAKVKNAILKLSEKYETFPNYLLITYLQEQDIELVEIQSVITQLIKKKFLFISENGYMKVIKSM